MLFVVCAAMLWDRAAAEQGGSLFAGDRCNFFLRCQIKSAMNFCV
jgi:hypothetical protein